MPVNIYSNSNEKRTHISTHKYAHTLSEICTDIKNKNIGMTTFT